LLQKHKVLAKGQTFRDVVFPHGDSDALELFSSEVIPEGLYIRRSSGEVFASIRSAARIVGKDKAYVRRWMSAQRGDKYAFETAEVQTPGGLQGGTLLPESALRHLISKYNPELAEACLGAGLKLYLYGSVGFQVQVKSPAQVEASHKYDRRVIEVLEENKKLLEENKDLTRKVHAFEKALGWDGLRALANSKPEFAKALMPGAVGVSLKQWMVAHCDTQLDDEAFANLTSQVHGMYKGCTHNPPIKAKPEGYKYAVQTYFPEHFSILEQCYTATLKEYGLAE